MAPPAASAAIVLTLAVGCAGDDGPSPSAPMPPGAPPQVHDRAPLPFCGQADVQPLAGEGVDEPARRCFAERRRAGRPAELITTRRTPEGDAITSVLRVVAEGRLEVFVDTTRDVYGGRRGWLVRQCRAYDPAHLHASRCMPPTPL